MTDDLKFIVNEINKNLKTEYNLISFDSMSPDSLLQVMVDVLHLYKASEKFEVKFMERDECMRRVIESLKKIQYRPQADNLDPSSFQRGLSQGDKKAIYPIFRYVFKNKEKINHLTYLAQFLLPISMPPEAMANPEIANLWNEYMLVMDEFKEAHKAHTQSSASTAQLKELRNDINAIELEKENVKKRIERTQVKLDKVPQQELILEASHFLRIERDRQKELQAHLEDQKLGLHRSKTLQERLQKDLSNARVATQSTSAGQLMEAIQEETQVMEFIVKQKLPKEMDNLRQEIKLVEEVIDEPNISKEYLRMLQDKIDSVSLDVQQLVEKRLAERGNQNDILLPFRQQAALVARNKEMAAEKLNQATKELREVDHIFKQKQKLLQDTVGEVILRGDDLKQYVNTLRAKSSVYKQQRAELAAVKAEVTDLTQTLENLKSQDPTLSTALEQVKEEEPSSLDQSLSRPDSPMESRGLTELSRIVDGLTRAVKAARERVTPLSQKLRPLRERIVELEDDRDAKKQLEKLFEKFLIKNHIKSGKNDLFANLYEFTNKAKNVLREIHQTYDTLNTTLSAEAATLRNEIVELENQIKKLEMEWQDLKSEYDRAESLLEKVRSEMSSKENNNSKGSSVKETLMSQIKEQEKTLEDLQAEKEELFRNQSYRRDQIRMWTDVKQLLEVKIKCLKEDKEKGPGGTLSIAKNSETFILQN